MENFQGKLAEYSQRNDVKNANGIIMSELGEILVRSKQDFADLLTFSGIPSLVTETDASLINKFINNVNGNKKLMVGAAFLVNQHNKTMGFDGELEVSDASVKCAYSNLFSYFNGEQHLEYIQENEDYHNAGGAVLGAITDTIKEGAKLGTKIVEGQQKKKYGAYDLAAKKLDAKNQMIQSAIQQRQSDSILKQKQFDQKSKTTHVAIIAGAVAFTALVAIGIYMATRKKTA